MERFVFVPTTDSEAEQVFHKKMADPEIQLTEHEIVVFKSALLLFFATEYHARGWTMQLHFGCRRDNNASKFFTLGPNTGYDTISGDSNFVAPLADYLSLLDSHDSLPRTILYSLNPNDDPIIDTLIGCFQSGGKLSGSDLDYVDKLTHALKSIKTTIAMVEAEDGGSYSDGSYRMYPHWNSYNDGMNNGSYARGRGSNARRDSMGRYR